MSLDQSKIESVTEPNNILLLPLDRSNLTCGVDEYGSYFNVEKNAIHRIDNKVGAIIDIINYNFINILFVIGHPSNDNDGIDNDYRVVGEKWFENADSLKYSMFGLVCEGHFIFEEKKWGNHFELIVTFSEEIRKTFDEDYPVIGKLYKRMYNEIFESLQSNLEVPIEIVKRIKLILKKYLNINYNDNSDADGKEFFKMHVDQLYSSINVITEWK